MAKKYKLVILECKDCKNRNYYYRRSTKGVAKPKLLLKKHCQFCRVHTEHSESK